MYTVPIPVVETLRLIYPMNSRYYKESILSAGIDDEEAPHNAVG